MGELIRKFMQLNGRKAILTLYHYLFGSQSLEVQNIRVFEDGERLGLILHGQDVFVYKQRLQKFILDDNVVEFADDKLKISIKF